MNTTDQELIEMLLSPVTIRVEKNIIVEYYGKGEPKKVGEGPSIREQAASRLSSLSAEVDRLTHALEEQDAAWVESVSLGVTQGATVRLANSNAAIRALLAGSKS